MHKDKRAEKITGTGGMGKAAVMGLLERHGKDGHSRVTAKVVPNTQAQDSKPGSARRTSRRAPKSSPMRSESYSDLSDDYTHQVDRPRRELRPRARSTPTAWKTSGACSSARIKGTYVSVEPFHLFRYLDEQAFRFNNRRENDGWRFVRALCGIVGRRITYRQLIGEAPAPA